MRQDDLFILARALYGKRSGHTGRLPGQRGSYIDQLFLIARQEKISQHDAAVRLLDEKQPSRTFVTPEQLAGTVAFLCSPADQITGTAIAVDGGWTAR